MSENSRGPIRRTFVRVYALGVLLLTCWAGYVAVAYLLRAVFAPVQIPARFVSWENATEVDRIHDAPVGENTARAPVSRYHQIESALPDDATNGCITSGCHAPLPHTKSKETRAFANMHVTFMDCEVCHTQPNELPEHLEWVNLRTGNAQPPPAHLRLRKLLETETERFEKEPGKVQGELLSLLDSALANARQSPRLKYIRLNLETAPPGSPVWRDAVESLRAELPYHARGDYGAKLTRDVPDGTRRGARKLLDEKAAAWLALQPGDKRRDEIYDEIHTRLLAKPGACLACHGGEPPRVDFVALGYDAARAAALRGSVIARQMQHIRDGQPFYLPDVLEEHDAP